MADVSGTLRAWSATPGSNLPSGSTAVGTGLDDNLRAIQAVVRQFLASPASNMASAATVDLATADGFFVNITGTTTVTSLGTEPAGIHYLLKFAGALTLTHNATSLILPGGQNITTAAGDLAWAISEGSGNWRLMYFPADGDTVLTPLYSANHVMNGALAFSVGASALTCSLKTQDGGDATSSDRVTVLFESATASSGLFNIRTVTAALSLTVSSGSTLGHGSTIAGSIYHYLIDNAGTVEYAVSNKFHGYNGIVTTTAEGGAGAADSASVMYSTAARTDVPFICVGRTKDTQTTAGTWAAAPSDVELAPFARKAPTRQNLTTTGAGTYTKPWDAIAMLVKAQGGGGGGGSATCGNGETAAGSGGAAGGYAEKLFAADAVGPTETTAVGAAGAAASAGGNTTFGSLLTANGGAAGTSATAGQVVVTQAAGGTASDGDVNVAGQNNWPAIGAADGSMRSGAGGNSIMGLGGSMRGTVNGDTLAGNAGTGFGAGGGAAARHNPAGSATSTGGAGTQGVIVVDEHYI